MDEHITTRCTHTRVRRDGLLVDAKTPDDVATSLALAKGVRQLNSIEPPRENSGILQVDNDYLGVDIEPGGVVHITDGDFWKNTARGLRMASQPLDVDSSTPLYQNQSSATGSVAMKNKANPTMAVPSIPAMGNWSGERPNSCTKLPYEAVLSQQIGTKVEPGGVFYQKNEFTNASAPRIRVGKLSDERLMNVGSHPKMLTHRVVTKGREALMTAIDNQLAQGCYQQVSLVGALYQLSVLKGMGGVGKSTLAREYAFQCDAQRRYQLIYWLDAETPEQLQASFENMCKAFGLGGYLDSIDAVASVYATLGTLQSYLLIFDNVKSHDAIANYLPTAEAYRGYLNQAHRSHCLITSRDRQGWSDVVEVSGFNEASFAEYVKHFLSPEYLGFQLSDIEDEKVIREFGNALGYHPLALTQAACLIKRRAAKRFSSSKMSSLRDYLNLLLRTPDFVLSSNEVFPQYMDKATDYPADVLKALQLSLQDFLSDTPDKNFARYLLQGLRYLHPTNIPDAWVLAMAKVFYAEQGLSQAESAAESALDRLTELSILEYDDSMHHYSGMHRLMHLALHAVQLDEDSPENQCGWQQAAQGLLASFPHVYYEKTTESSTPWLTQLPHVLAAKPLVASNEDSLLTAKIRSRLALYYVYHQRDFVQAKTYALAAVSHWEILYQRTQDDLVREQLAEMYNTLARIDAYGIITSSVNSVPWLEKSVALYKNNLRLGSRISALCCMTAKRLHAEQLAYPSLALIEYEYGLNWFDSSESRVTDVSKRTFEQAMLYRALGLAYSKYRKTELALLYYEKSKAILVDLGNKTLLLELYDELSEAYYALEQFNDYRKPLQIYCRLVVEMYGVGSVDYIEAFCRFALDKDQAILSAKNSTKVLRLVEKHRLSWSDVTRNNQSLLMVIIKAGALDVLEAFNLTVGELSQGDSSGKTPLMQAAIRGHISIVKYLLQKKVPVDAIDTQGMTAFMHAAFNGRLDVLNFLLTEDLADHRNIKSQAGLLAFHYAIMGGHMPCVQRLFEVNNEVLTASNDQASLILAIQANQAEILTWLLSTYRVHSLQAYNNADGFDMFLDASYFGHLACAKVLLDDGTVVTKKDEGGRNALLLATIGGQTSMVEWLLSLPEFSLEDPDDAGMTPLLLAAWLGHLALAKALLEQGASMAAKDHLGRNALLLAVEEGHLKMVSWLLDQPEFTLNDLDEKGLKPLLLAARLGHLAMVQALLHRGASIEARDRHGLTPLLLAARLGHLTLVQFLLEQGASTLVRDRYGHNILLLAAYNGNCSMVDWLLEQPGINLEDRDEGITPFLMAAGRGHLDLAQALLERGASPTVKTKVGCNALLLAAVGGHAMMVDWLLSQPDLSSEDSNNEGLTPLTQELSVHERDDAGNTAILLAALEGNISQIEWLLNQGADLGDKNHFSRNVLSLAARTGHQSCVEWLITQGCSVLKTDSTGNNALMLAEKGGHLPLIQYLQKNTELNLTEKPELPAVPKRSSLTSRKTKSFLTASEQTLRHKICQANNVINEDDILPPASQTGFSQKT